MKKFTFVLAAALISLGAAAHELNNPVGADGRYIVKYDCSKGAFAESNDMQVDETFTLAVDVTGTWLEEWLKGTPAAEGANRGIAFNCWTNFGGADQGILNGDVVRLKQISGNIWGMTRNMAQNFVNADSLQKAMTEDYVVYASAQLFGFEYTADNAGAGWWMWDNNEIAETRAPGADCLFTFAPFKSAKNEEEFYSDDEELSEDMYGMSVKGYAAPCVLATAIEDAAVENKKADKFIEDGQLYILHNGVKYNALGTIVK